MDMMQRMDTKLDIKLNSIDAKLGSQGNTLDAIQSQLSEVMSP